MCYIVIIKDLKDLRRVTTVIANLITISKTVRVIAKAIKGILVAKLSFNVKEE
jgi:hypothetical protein